MSETRIYEALPLNRKEIARYAHCDYEAWQTQIEDAVAEALPILTNRVCFRIYPITFSAEGTDLGFAKTTSEGLKKNLRNCDRVILFAATAGYGIDRLIQKYNRLSPAKALLLQAVGSEAVEAVCNRFCEELRQTYGAVRPRFSPGYGDLPLTLQKEIMAALSCERQIGVTLNDSLLMSPSKSVTALVGIEAEKEEQR